MVSPDGAPVMDTLSESVGTTRVAERFVVVIAVGTVMAVVSGVNVLVVSKPVETVKRVSEFH